MTVPTEVRTRIQKMLWKRADELSWSKISPNEKSRWYDIWTKEAGIGQELATFKDPREVRVYIKDTLMKGYNRSTLSMSETDVIAALGLPKGTILKQRYSKPHGAVTDEKLVLCWSRANQWKTSIIALWERAYLISNSRPFGLVLFGHAPRYSDNTLGKQMVHDAAAHLGIEKLVWLDER